MQKTAFSLQNRYKNSDKNDITSITSQQDPNSLHACHSNNNSNQSTSRQTLKMQIGSKLDKITALSNKNFINVTRNGNKSNTDFLQQGKNNEEVINAINQMKNMPNNVPSSTNNTVKPNRIIHPRSKNLSIQIQNPAQNSSKISTNPNVSIAQASNHPPSVTLHRNNSNNSIISQLELDQIQAYEIEDPHKAEQRLIIKICDGVYIGGHDSIWDVDTLSLNYISHLVRVNQVQDNQQTKSVNNMNEHKHKQQYVPELITYIHSIPYQFQTNSPQRNHQLLDSYKKITQFIQHAHQQGQSCLIICRGLSKDIHSRNKSKTKRRNSKYNTMNTQENQVQKQKDRLRQSQRQKQEKQRCFYQCLYKPAVVVAGFLMNKYSWSMLKALQFVIARLTAGQKTAQILSNISSKQSKKHGRNPLSQGSKHNSITSLYSQLITHMLPQLPHTQTTQKMPTIHSLPIKSLQNLQICMISNNRHLTYGWNKNKQTIGSYVAYDDQYLLQVGEVQWSSIKQQQLVLTNTYINCMMGSDLSYKGILQEDLHSKSSTNLRSYSNNHSIANLSTNLHNGSIQIKSSTHTRRSLKILTHSNPTNTNQLVVQNPPNNVNNRSTNSSKQKQNRHSLDVILKKPLLKTTKPNPNTSAAINKNNSAQISKKVDELSNNPSCVLGSTNLAHNIINSDSTTSLNFNHVTRNNSLSSFKNKNKPPKKKHVTWSPMLITTVKQSTMQNSQSNTNNNKIPQKMCEQVQQYAKNIKSTYKITGDMKPHPSLTSTKHPSRTNLQTENNINNGNIIPNQKNKSISNNTHASQQQMCPDKKNQYLNSQNKSKIVINVMGMIGSKNSRTSQNNTQRQRQQTKLSHLNRKSKLYQSKARLPTFHDIINSSSNSNNNTKTNTTTNNSMLNSYNPNKQSQYPTQLQNQVTITMEPSHNNSQANQNKRKIRLSMDDRYTTSQQEQKLSRKHIHTQQPSQQQKQQYLHMQQQQQQEQQQHQEHKVPKMSRSTMVNTKNSQKNKVIADTINKLKQIKNSKSEFEFNYKKSKNKIHAISTNLGGNYKTNNNINGSIHTQINTTSNN